MDTVRKAKSGNFYAVPCILKDSDRAYSQAILHKIKHNDPTKKDIALKLGRYFKQNGEPVLEKPKSSLTLTNDELDKLIKYLRDYYKPLELEVKRFINLEDTEDIEIINRFKKISMQDGDTAKFFIENGLMPDNVYLSVEAIKRNESLKKFNSMLDEDLSEHDWQCWFKNNKWVLGSDFAKILEDRTIDPDHIADYLMKAYDGFIDIVEIKKPCINFWLNNKDHENWIPSTELIKAITQCQKYILSIEQESNSIKFKERMREEVSIIKPRCILVLGRSNTWDKEKREAYRLLNSSFVSLNIITYDQLYQRAKNMLTTKEEQCEKKDKHIANEITEDLPF